jgi:hypothetical protein
MPRGFASAAIVFLEGEMRHWACFAIVGGLLFATLPASADTIAGVVTAQRVSGHYAGVGGEFTLNPTLLSNSAYSSEASGKGGAGWEGSFQTFCVEYDEFILPPNTLNAILSTTFLDGTEGSKALLGGANTNSGDNLDAMTAYLYTRFATGTLDDIGYVYTPGSGRNASAQALQNTIWKIEQEITSALTGLAQTLYDNAWEATHLGADNQITWSGIGNVRILNLYNPANGANSQDQLYLTAAPVPLPATAWVGGLLLIGFGVWKWLRGRTALA